MNKKLLILLLLLPLCLQSQAGKSDSIASVVFNLIYQDKLLEAEEQLVLQKAQLDDFYYLLLNLDLHWWKYRTTDSKEDTQAIDSLFEKLDKKETRYDWQKIQLLLVKSYKLRYEKTKLNFIGMLSTRSEIKNLVDEINIEELPLPGKQQKLFESYIIMFQYIDNINFLGIQSSLDERKELLYKMEKFASEEDIMLSTIARFFLARMYQKVEKEPETGLIHYKILTTKYPTNKTFTKYRKECEDKL